MYIFFPFVIYDIGLYYFNYPFIAGVKFSAKGDIGILASVTLDQNSSNEEAVIIEIHEPVSLTFSSRYLVLFFAKAKNLSNRAKVVMKKDRPLKVEYIIPDYGYVFFYLAPKIEDSDEN